MRIGFITNLTEEDFKFAKENGIPCVEYNCSDNLDFLEKKEEIKKWKEKYKIDFSMVGMFGRNHISDSKEEREKIFSDVKKIIDFCSELEIPVFVTGAGEYNNLTLKEKCKRAVDILSSYVDYAKKRGIKIAIYNCRWTNFLVNPKSWEIVLKELKDVGIKYDPSHAFYEGDDYQKETRDWGNRFYHCHAKGAVIIDGKRFEDPPAGMDQINWGIFISILYHHNYDGDINIEPHCETWLGKRRYPGILIAKRHLEQFLVR